MAKPRKKTKKKTVQPRSWAVTGFLILLLVMTVGFTILFIRDTGENSGIREVEGISHGIDVARYQGTIDWAEVAGNGVDFAMVRLGYRGLQNGEIVEDTNARYNLQEASRYGVKLGAYFFSTAVTEEEAREEARWAAELLAKYPITYPVAYDCEGFANPNNRHAFLTPTQRTDIALAFLREIEKLGYEGMFYGSKNDMTADSRWETSRIRENYKVWLAHYTDPADPLSAPSDYPDPHRMWQYTQTGFVPGISGAVDRNIAYFAYEGIAMPKDRTPPATVGPDAEAMMEFESVWEQVTAKNETNLRDIPSQDDFARILVTLKNGDVVMRTGVSESGWSRLVYEGITCYAVSSYLTTDLTPPPTEAEGIDTVFQKVNDRVTAKEAVNLRTIPSVTDPESRVVVKIQNGDVVQRTGINEDVGWSRVVWNGQILYCVTSYLEIVSE